MKNLILGLLVFISLIGIVNAHTGEDEYGHHDMMSGMMMGSFGGFGVLFGWVFMILIIVALVLLILWLVKQIQKK